jgi:hypothetical protein
MHQYIINDGMQDFHNWKLEGCDDQYLCLAFCSPAKHAEMEADPDITSLSPKFATEREAREWYDAQTDSRMALHGSKELIRAVIRG